MSAPAFPPRRLGAARALLWSCFPAFAVGLFAPGILVAPELGPATRVLEALGALEGPRLLSVWDSLWKMLTHGPWLLGLLLLLLTAVVPLLKLLALDYGLRCLAAGAGPPERSLALATTIGRWAFTEILVAAFVFAAQATSRLGFRMEFRAGFYVFAACALVTLALSTWLERAWRRAAA